MTIALTPEQKELLKIQHNEWLQKSETLTFLKNLERKRDEFITEMEREAEGISPNAQKVINLLNQSYRIRKTIEYARNPESIVNSSK